jgi:PmbA protein
VEEILERAKKVAEQAEVYQVTAKGTPVQFEANRLKQIQTKESVSTSLRIIKNGRIGFAQASGKISSADLIEMAVETSQFGAQAKFEFPGASQYPEVGTFDPQTDSTSLDDMATLGQNMIDTIRKQASDIVCEAHISKGVASLRIINSRGGEAKYSKSYFSLSVEGVIIKDSDMLFVGDGQSSCHPITDTKPITDKVQIQLERAKNKAEITSGAVPVIFLPDGVAGALMMPLLSAFNGKTVLHGASPLKDKLGTQVFDPKFSLWDDPSFPYQVGSCPCDDEGIPTGKKSLVENGVVARFIYDLQTAGLAGTKSTGNASRNGGLPAPSPHALTIDAGTMSFEDMVKDIKEGIIIEELMGATQGNILNGDFSGNILLGYKIENGKIVGRVKNTMASGNVFEVLKKIVALGSDTRWIGGFVRTPSIYCSALQVSAKA